MRPIAVIAVGALVLTGAASASHPATRTEMYFMSGAPIYTGNGSFTVWARVSTRDEHYAVYFARDCPARGGAACLAQTHPTEAFLLRRTKLTLGGWRGSLAAEAQLRPRYGVARLCRAAPKPVRQDLLAAVCKR